MNGGRHHQDHVLRRAHDNRKHDDRKGERPGEPRTVPGRDDQQGIHEHAGENRGQPHHHVDGKPDQIAESAVLSVDGEPDASGKSGGNSDQNRHQGNENGSEDRISDSVVGFARGFAPAEDEVEADHSCAVFDDRPENPQHTENRKRDARHGKKPHHRVQEFPEKHRASGGRNHFTHFSPLFLSIFFR